MKSREMFPSKVIVDEPWTVPNPILCPDDVPSIVPFLMQALMMVIVPAILVPLWVKVTTKVPVVEAYLVLA